ncbi:putative toxin-antitoxin system toxin component, PIN family [Phocaeicola sartorii]|jgi:probable toxin-antitoxin system toxin component, PIN family|uniref:PIN domain-containing protein n=1 Tax=Phocaeicola sartorii TaxID=671267 RepID=R9I056_9BACT|nr:putative toxin-antitoxin system toxin component, PIN family [Phocaeicola sartorii]EOS09589.1 hypothetical protein C802_03702 [Phocaeicola sartorii]MCR1844712.1 putative toxin-antitoxin system toxin component, PIN family [Phocaeicola sartorii]NUL00035.1 putative toxin-antitoxin system toxin component, PIN family [Phocaeicola sartorii]
MKNGKEVRVIVDTNIWISFLIGRKMSHLMTVLTHPEIQFIFSKELLTELYCVTQRKKFAKYFSASDKVDEFMMYLQTIGRVYELPHDIPSRCRDVKDDYLLELAIQSDADFLITGDNDLLVIAKIEHCRIVTIMEFELLWSGDSSDRMLLNESEIVYRTVRIIK